MTDLRDYGTFALFVLVTPLFLVVFLTACLFVLPVLAALWLVDRLRCRGVRRS